MKIATNNFEDEVKKLNDPEFGALYTVDPASRGIALFVAATVEKRGWFPLYFVAPNGDGGAGLTLYYKVGDLEIEVECEADEEHPIRALLTWSERSQWPLEVLLDDLTTLGCLPPMANAYAEECRRRVEAAAEAGGDS